MTWQQILDTGNGAIEYRIEIEGFDYSFVTNSRMVNLNGVNGVKRVNGLKREGIQINAEAILPTAEIKLNSNNFNIVDWNQYGTKAFRRKITKVCHLLNNINQTDTLLEVDDPSLFNVGDYIYVGSEVMKIVDKPYYAPKNITRFLVQRAQMNSFAVYHYANTDLGQAIQPEIVDIPSIRGKRITLYAYGQGDNLQGNGTAIWRGIILTGASEENLVWSFEAGPLTELFKSKIGLPSDKINIRGYNFEQQSWKILVELLDSANMESGNTTDSLRIQTNGFYGSIFDLVNDFNNQLNTGASSWATRPFCRLLPTGELVFGFTTGVTPLAIRWSTQEGPLEPIPGSIILSKGGSVRICNEFLFERDGRRAWPLDGSMVNESGRVQTVAGSKSYVCRLNIKPFLKNFTCYYSDLKPNNSFTEKRLYLNIAGFPQNLNNIGVFHDDTGDQNTSSTPSTADGVGNVLDRIINQPITFNQSERYITVQFGGDFVIKNDDKYILIGLDILWNVPGGRGGVLEFLIGLKGISPQLCQQSYLPLITSNDFNFDDMRNQMKNVSPNSVNKNRKYVFYKAEDELGKILSEELKLIGYMWATTQDGKLTVRQMRQITSREIPDVILDSRHILTDKSLIRFDESPFGNYNAVTLKTRWNARENKSTGQEFTHINTTLVQRNGYKRKSIVIEPRSDCDPTLLYYYTADSFKILTQLTSMFGDEYYVANVEVPLNFFDLGIGNVVKIKNKQVPNFAPDFYFQDSRRGSATMAGVLIGKSFNMDTGFGTLRVLISPESFLGEDNYFETNFQNFLAGIYVPDGIIISKSQNSSTSYTTYVDATAASRSLPENTTLADIWQVGDGMMLYKFNSSSLDTATVTVTSIVGANNALTMSLTGSFPTDFNTAGYQYRFTYPSSSDSRRSTNQQAFGFVASGSFFDDVRDKSGTSNFRYMGF